MDSNVNEMSVSLHNTVNAGTENHSFNASSSDRELSHSRASSVYFKSLTCYNMVKGLVIIDRCVCTEVVPAGFH
jgi:hypothetical protein